MSSEITPLLVSYEDASHLLGISPKTIRNQTSAGTFPIPVLKIGGRRLLRLADIHSFVSAPAAVTPDPAPVKHGRGRPRKIVQQAQK